MLSKLSNVLEKQLTHINHLIVVALGSCDVAPVVLELKIPPLTFFSFLMILEVLLLLVDKVDLLYDILDLAFLSIVQSPHLFFMPL